MTTHTKDRRNRRSEIIFDALELQLRASADRARFSSLVLADDLGLVVSATGNRSISEHLAAISPGLVSMMMPWHGEIPTNRGSVKLAVAPFRFGDILLYLSATEGMQRSVSKELLRSGLGVVRILSN